MNAPVMSMFANELDCLRARDKYHTDRIAELEGLKRQLKITKARLFKAQAEFERMALHATTLEQANTRLTAHIKQIAAKHDVQRHDNYGNSYLVDLHETFCDFALSIFTKENHEATTD